jgi:hypothetical protein
MTAVGKNREIQVICPICKSEKQLNIPESVISQSKQLTTVSIQKGMLCNHHFQAFIDKNFKVRGYQKIDFEITPKKIKEKGNNKDNKESLKKNEDELFENLITEGNYIEYKPKNSNFTNLNAIPKRDEEIYRRKDMSLEEIYDLFWEFIDEDNREFRELIINDKRRKSLKHALNPIEH